MSSRVPAAPPQTRTLRLAVIFGLLVIVSYADPLFFRRIYAGRDPVGYHYPVEHAVHDAYARGRLPVWMPEISGGRPLLANPNVGTRYPARPVLSLLPFPTSMRVFPVLHWIGSGVGMLILLRALRVSPLAAWLGAMTYTFSAVSVSEVFYPNCHPGFALLPWLLWTLARGGAGPAARAIPAGLVLGLVLLSGDAFGVALALLAMIAWLALESPREDRPRAAATAAGAFAIAGLIAAPQILAALLWVGETNRGVLGLKLGEVLLFSLSPWRLLELAVPYPFGSTWEVDHTRIWGWPVFRHKAAGFYSGLYCGALALIALPPGWKSPGPGVRFARIFLLVSLGLAVLPGLTPAAWRGMNSPVPLRYPEKFAPGLVLALAVLAAKGIDDLRGRRPPRWALGVGAALALVAAAAAWKPAAMGKAATALVGAEERHAAVAGDRLPGAVAEAGLLWMATLAAIALLSSRRRLAIASAAILLTAVPIIPNRRIAQTSREENVLGPTPFSRWVRRRDHAGDYRVLGQSGFRAPSQLEASQLSSDPGQGEISRRNWYHYTQALWGQATIFNQDFDAGDFSRMESLRRIAVRAAEFRDAHHFFGGLGLRWGIRLRDQEPYPGFRRVRGDALQDWDEHVAPYPDIRILPGWREESGALAALEALPRLAPGEVVIETGAPASGRSPLGVLRMIEKSPERLRFESTTAAPGWIFVLRSFWNHRRIRMDGREVDDFPAQLAFSAVRVPAGRHLFEWEEGAPGWKAARFGPLAALVVSGLALARARRRRAA
ncbi:MAG: hypothetical protein ABR576_08490 [Thermoanaerobaculia bacterium]